MPWLSEISYSHEATVKAFKDYYEFLVTMYLDEDDVATPPEGGWPNIAQLEPLGKTREVLDLLSYIPYIKSNGHYRAYPQCSGWSYWADWPMIADGFSKRKIAELKSEVDGIRGLSEDFIIAKDAPDHVVGLTYGTYEDPHYLLDTKYGIVYWFECPLRDFPREYSAQPILDDPHGTWPEELSLDEANWRAEGINFTIPDFFEVLKEQFRKLNFIPIGTRMVTAVFGVEFTEEEEEMIMLVQMIYREHGWPNLESYRPRKLECMAAIEALVREQYPDLAGGYFDHCW